MFSALGSSAFAKEKTMTRLGSLVLCTALVLGGALVGCGSSTPSGGAGGAGGGGSAGSVLDLVPLANAVSGWTVDPNNSKTVGVVAATATTATAASDLIDGGSEAFFNAQFSPMVLAWQNYVNTTLVPPTTYTLKLYIIQMSSAAQASALYASLTAATSTDTLYTSNTWTATSPVVGNESRITDSGTDWWINFDKGVYYVEVRLSPSYDASFNPSDPVSQAEAMRFAQAVAAKM
jgi:hypothetical protein